MKKLSSLGLATIALIISSLLVGLVAGFLVTSLTDLRYVFSPQERQLVSQYQQLNQSYQQINDLLRRYVYTGLVYDLRTLVILVADVRVMVSIANLTSSPELLQIARINLETAINVSDKILSNIQTVKTLTTSQRESLVLDQIRDKMLVTKVNLENTLSDVNNAISTRNISPDLVSKSDRLFNSVSQTIDEIISYLRQLT